MIDHLLNQMRLQAALVQGQKLNTTLATVISYDPNNYAAKVSLMPEQVETGWLPVISPWIGNQWGFYAPPTIGDLVLVHFIDGNVDVGVVGQRFYNNVDRPLAVNSGEFWITHKSGSALRLHNDGSVDLIANAGLNITGTSIKVGASGQTLQALVLAAFQSLFNNHTHPVTALGSPTGVTATPMGSSHLTTTITGG